jgi:hypothetical protein
MEDLIAWFSKAERENVLHPLLLTALLTDHDTLTLGQVVKLVHGKPSTVKLRFRELIDKGYLEPKGKGRGAHYIRADSEKNP